MFTLKKIRENNRYQVKYMRTVHIPGFKKHHKLHEIINLIKFSFCENIK